MSGHKKREKFLRDLENKLRSGKRQKESSNFRRPSKKAVFSETHADFTDYEFFRLRCNVDGFQ